jgi:hypothetical protein
VEIYWGPPPNPVENHIPGGGTDTLQGSAADTNWTIDGQGSGSVGTTKFEGFANLVDRAVKRGEFPGDADPIVFLEALIAPLYFRLLVTNESFDTWSDADHIDRLLKAYFKPVAKRKKR